MIWHWWFIPCAIFFLGCLWSNKLSRESSPGGMFPDMGPTIIFLGTLFVTGAIVLGHFI